MPGPRNNFSVEIQYPGCVMLAGSFICDGANAPTIVEPSRTAKFTVSAPSTGKYTVTLVDGPSAGIIAAFAELMPNEANTTKRAFVHNWLSGDGTFEIQTQSATGTDANLASFATVSFVVFLTRSSLAVG